MALLKTGTRLKSAVCDTEVMVIAAPKEDVEVTCGGAAMLAPGQAANGATLADDAASGTALGKRYVDGAGSIELLCVKPGKGALSLNGAPLVLKEAKPLPSSD